MYTKNNEPYTDTEVNTDTNQMDARHCEHSTMLLVTDLYNQLISMLRSQLLCIMRNNVNYLHEMSHVSFEKRIQMKENF